MNKYFKIILTILLVFASQFMFSQEICNNGIDDDGDGLVDLNDTEDCFCDSIITNNVPSLIPNPSFEGHSCCPEENSQLDCANTWIQASQATSDYFNTCGFTGAAPLPFPDGTAGAGVICTDNYSEYIGACLNSVMQAGQTYQIQFDLAFEVITDMGEHYPTFPVDLPPLEFTIYGTTNCSYLPFDGTNCPVGYGNWQVLGTVSVNPEDIHAEWDNFTISFTPPANIRAIVLGGPCDYPSGEEYSAGLLNPVGEQLMPYFFVDNLILNNASLWGIPITVEGEYCTNNLELSVTTNAIQTVQWYLDGVAIDNEYFNTLEVSQNGLPPGNYTVVVSDFANCATGSVTIIAPEIEIYPINNMSSCHEIYLPPITGENLTGNQNYYTEPYGQGEIVTSPVTEPMMVYAYDAIGDCFDQEGFFVNPYNSPNVMDIPDQTACSNYDLPLINGTQLTGNQNYYNGPNGTGGIVNSPILASQLVYIYDGNNECYDEESFNVTIYDTPDITDIPELIGCNYVDLPGITGNFLTGNQNYYSMPNGQGNIIDTHVTHSQVIYAYDVNLFCSDNNPVNITIYNDLPAYAGEDAFACGTSITLEATPSIPGSDGYWTGPGIISDPEQPETEITNEYGTYTYYWYESYDVCDGLDSITVSFITSPAPFISVEADTVCTNSYNLQVENVQYPGFWAAYNPADHSLISPAPLYFPSVTSPDVTVVVGNFNGAHLNVEFVWTEQHQVIDNICNTTASAIITFAKQPVASVGAIDEAEVCGMSFTGLSADMTGSEWADGEWISPEISCLFADCTQPNTSATLINDGVFGDTAYVTVPFLWTINNYGCSDIDTMWVSFYRQPHANAGIDGAVCGSEYNLGAVFDFTENNNYTPSGSWATENDFIHIETPDSDSTYVNAGEFGIFEFVFRENNSNLSSCFSTDTVSVEFLEIPVIYAGDDTYVCGNCTELNATSAGFSGTWLPTPGAHFTDFTDTATVVCVPPDCGEYVFSWIESNQAVTSTLSCSSIDQVVYTFFKIPHADILTDEDDSLACGLQFTRLRAENPGSDISAYWYSESTGVSFGNPFSYNTWVDVSAYGCYDFYWIEETGPAFQPGYCTDTAGPLNICFFEIPEANAGSDTIFCGLSGTLNAIPSVGTGVWSDPSTTNVTIADHNNPESAITSFIYNTDPEYVDSFTLIWTEDNGHCTDNATVEVIFSRVPGSGITVIPPKCFGEAATISANDNNQAHYSWNFQNGNIQSSLTNQNGGIYQHMVYWDNENYSHEISLVVTNEWDCPSPINIDTIQEPPAPEYGFTIISDTCSLSKGGIIFNDTSENSFFWIDTTIGPLAGSPVTSIYNLPTGSYPVRRSYLTTNIENYSYYINTFGTANCIDTTFYEISAIGMLEAEISVSADVILSELVAPNATVVFLNTSDYDNVSKRCEWHFDDGTIMKNCDELVEHVYTKAGCYEPFLIISNRDLPECRDTARLKACINIDNASKIEIPNIFSPNADGINDYFQVKAQTLKSFNGVIVNRWGKTIFEWTNWEDYEAGWDGKLSGGSYASPGVYFYIISAEGFDGEIYDEQGAFHLMREQ